MDGVMTVKLKEYFDVSMIFLTDPTVTYFSNKQDKEPFSYRSIRVETTSLITPNVISNKP